jgi:hypothetical protein
MFDFTIVEVYHDNATLSRTSRTESNHWLSLSPCIWISDVHETSTSELTLLSTGGPLCGLAMQVYEYTTAPRSA